MSIFLASLCLLGGIAGRQEPIVYKNLAIYPIASGLSGRPANVITLDEGIKDGTVVITESGSQPPLIRNHPPSGGAGFGFPREQQANPYQGGGAQVNTLWLTNTSGKTLLLIAGEMVVGGQQDRIIQKDGLIPSGKQPVDLAVFCVEHGRWTSQTQKFGTAIGGGGRGMGGFAAPAVRGAAVVNQDQGRVWSKVAQQVDALGTTTETGTYRANYVDPKSASRMEEFVQAIDARFPIQNAAGAVVAINGRLVWMDRFDSPQTFRKYWPKLLKSYALEAMAAPTLEAKYPSYASAIRYAESREGKASFEGQEGLSKLTKVESDTTVLYELEDLQSSPGILVHANKVTKN